VTALTAAARLRVAGATLRGHQASGAIVRTASFNVASAATAAVGGVILARAVGPAVRGEYAAVIAWLGMLLVIGEMGQTAAVCFHVSRDPRRARSYVATARAMMLVTGGIAIAAGMRAAPVLAHGSPGLASAYRLAFTASAIGFLGASYTFALQARSIGRWNLVRVSQPALGTAAIAVLWRLRLLSLHTAVMTLAVTMAVQLGYAYYSCRRCALAPGTARLKLVRRLAAYGLVQVAATAPASVNAYLDQLVLSQTVSPADLGRYAIAVSLATVPLPLVSAIGNVAFPRLAARRGAAADDRRLPKAAMLASAGAAAAIVALVAAGAPWAVPLIFGAQYRGAVPLLWILAPGAVCLACGQVAGDLLRGLGRPGQVAAAQGLAAVFTVALLAALLPSIGVAAAAIASTAAYGAALAVLIRCLWRAPGPKALSEEGSCA
jgi:O-antigen/teichoic acid export membrane protein